MPAVGETCEVAVRLGEPGITSVEGTVFHCENAVVSGLIENVKSRKLQIGARLRNQSITKGG